MVARLREFEGWHCLWRLPVAALVYAIGTIVFIGAALLAAYIARHGFDVPTAVLSATIVAATGWLVPRLARRRLHVKLIEGRLWTFEKPNPATEVPVLLRPVDAEAAGTALRRAKFSPQACVRLGEPPSYAPDLTYKMAVHEPEAWPQSESDMERTRRIVGVLEATGIRTRVGGVDAGTCARATAASQ